MTSEVTSTVTYSGNKNFLSEQTCSYIILDHNLVYAFFLFYIYFEAFERKSPQSFPNDNQRIHLYGRGEITSKRELTEDSKKKLTVAARRFR